MSKFIQYPPQRLSFTRKNKKWRKQNIDWADSKSFFNYSPVRRSILHKKINYDLLEGKLNMEDLGIVLNPDKIKAGFIPETIPHYPIMNSKLDLLRGEEASRLFEYRITITNPNAISEIENNKKKELFQKLDMLIRSNVTSEEEFNTELEKLNDYYNYEWQDFREIRGNALLSHYKTELNIPKIFNDGFMDAMAVGEEIYQCDIVGGEPIIQKLNPQKLSVFRSGYSNNIEDADVLIYEDYWSPGKIIDIFHESLTNEHLKYLEEKSLFTGSSIDSMGNVDERYGFINADMVSESFDENFFWEPFGSSNAMANGSLPFDTYGNVRVLRVYWKSLRKIKKIKSYNSFTGEEEFTLMPETYIVNKDKGEEEEILWINEAWEGTKIGENIYIDIKPRTVQYNRISNPSRCHFGIIGTIYNLNEGKPFSMVDRMKQYNYLYDAAHDKLVKLMSRDLGKLVDLDLALVPKGWEVEKWMYFAKVNGIRVKDSFKEGNIGAATGKLAGGLNNASSGAIDVSRGNEIQFYINLCEFIKGEMSEIVGITKQREGQISNRETVGGVERSTLQSSHITEWLFLQHEDLKKRVLECFLETAKIAFKGKSKKFEYILPDSSKQVMEIDGDEFAECDYGLCVDNSQRSQALNQQLDSLAQAALQTQTLDFSTIMKLYGSSSLAEKQRMVERNEQKMREMQQQQQQQQMQLQQQQIQQMAETEQAKMQQADIINQRDNETKVLVAQINGQAEAERFAMMSQNDGIEEPVFSEESKAKLKEQMREFDAKLKLDKEKLAFDKEKSKRDAELKRQHINKKTTTK